MEIFKSLTPQLDLGNLKVYNVKYSMTLKDGTKVTSGFYWLDNESPQAFGPFPSLYDTCNHYAEILKSFKEPNILELVIDHPPEVIEVDFSIKKRIA